MMQGHVGIETTEPGEQRKGQPAKGGEGVASEGREYQIEPDHVGFFTPDGGQQRGHAPGIVKGPATRNRESFRFRLRVLQLVRQYGKIDVGISLQLTRNMITVFA